VSEINEDLYEDVRFRFRLTRAETVFSIFDNHHYSKLEDLNFGSDMDRLSRACANSIDLQFTRPLAETAATWCATIDVINSIHSAMRLGRNERVLVHVRSSADMLDPELQACAYSDFHLGLIPSVQGIEVRLESMHHSAFRVHANKWAVHGWYHDAASIWLRLKCLSALVYPLLPNLGKRLWRELGGVGDPMWPRASPSFEVAPVRMRAVSFDAAKNA